MFLTYLLLAALGFCRCAGFSLLVVGKSYPLVETRELLIAAAPLAMERGLQALGRQRLRPAGSRAQTR